MRISCFSRYIFTVFPLIFLVFFTAKAQETAILRADPTVSLVYKDTLRLPSFFAFELPVRIKSSYSISAISLGFYFPEEDLVIDTMEMIDGTKGYYYSITSGLFRMAWSDVIPINTETNDSIIVLKMNTLDISDLRNTIRLLLYAASEFADQNANIIENVVLEIPEIEFLKPDPVDSIAGNYVNIYPNPFNDYTTIYFSLKTESQVKISISNISGMELKMFEEKTYTEGNYMQKLDGLDLAKGVYFLKFEIRNPEASGSKLFKIFSIK
jgi:hypothetical protein